MCVLGADGQFLAVNAAFEHVLGHLLSRLPEQRLPEQRLPDLTHPDDIAANQRRLAHFLKHRVDAGKRATRMTFRHIAPTGAVMWIEWRLAVALPEWQICCTGRDVTRRIRQLAKSRERYRQTREAGLQTVAAQQEADLYAKAIHNLPIGFFILQLDDFNDANSLRLRMANPASSACLGIPLETSIGKRVTKIFPNLENTDILERYVEVICTGQPIDLGEVTYEDGRIERSVFAVKAFPLAENYVGVAFEDITVRTLKEEDLLVANRLLANTTAVLENRNRELDQFAHVASHDLKAPLRAIANLATWIEEDLGSTLPEDNKEQFDLLKSRVNRMEGLINGLLTYSRIGRVAQSYEQVDVGQLLSEIVASLLPADSLLPANGVSADGVSADGMSANSSGNTVKNREMTVEIAPDMPVISAQAVPLSQVFQNLISNAIKHHDRQDGHIKIFASVRDDAYEFAVSDDGPGIEPDYHDKIFAIFQTLKARDDYESTGIGLSIVKKILTEVGGSITVDSAAGEGTTFRFTWPKIL